MKLVRWGVVYIAIYGSCRPPYLHVSSRVILGAVERLEAVVVVFYLRCVFHPVYQGVAHVDEHIGG